MTDLTWQSSKIIPEPNSGCWIWLGTINQHGYGRTRLANGRTQVAHRALYEFHHGVTVPAHLQVDHLCMVRCCVNPDHLEVVTRAENVRRSFLKRFAHRKGFCINGHEMTPENTQRRKQGNDVRVVCRTCTRATRFKWDSSPEGKQYQRAYNQNRKLKAAPTSLITPQE